MTAVSDRVEQALRPVVEARGFDLERVDVQPAGRRRVLRVVVDGESGLDLDTIASLTRELSSALDASNAMGDQPYTLEVTSPGIERPLTQPRHWRRNRSRLVTITLADGRSVSGRIVSSDDEGVTLQSDDGRVDLRYDDISRAQVQVEFNAPAPIEEEG